MFYGARAFNADVSKWNTAAVSTMDHVMHPFFLLRFALWGHRFCARGGFFGAFSLLMARALGFFGDVACAL
jgi:surface protein